jgi:two-component system OmpR family sensor kinase
MKVPLPRRLSSRLALKQTAWFALLAIVLAWSAYGVLARHIYGQFDDELQDRSIAVRTMLQVSNGQVRWLNKEADAEVRQQFEQSIRYFQLLDESQRTLDGSKFMVTLKLPWTEEAERARQSGKVEFETFPLPGGERLRVVDTAVTGVSQRRYLLRIGMSMAEVDGDAAQHRMFIFALFPLILLVHGINSWLLTAKELKPLERISEAARQINPIDLSQRFPVSGNQDELDELSVTLNGTLSRLQSALQRMSEFLRNLSHEIRQPLTVMRAEAEQALQSGTPDENVRSMLSSQLEHVQLLARTVSDLMELAQSETSEIKLHCQTEDLSELVQTAIDGMRLKAAERNIHVSGTVQQNVVGQFDAGQLWRLLLNLLDNAIKYNHPEGRVDVNLSAHGMSAIISVSDSGLGMSPEELKHIYERGYRAPSNMKSASGTGLGLHFAQAIAQAHGGDIEVTSIPGQGSRFRVVLPIGGRSALVSEQPARVRDSSVN